MRFAVVVVGVALVLSGAGSRCAKGDTTAEKVYGWLVSQQQATGILGNQEGEDFSGVYTNAVAAICYMHEGDITRAEAVFSFFNGHLDSVAKQEPGGFCQFWDAGTGQPLLDTDRWVGDNAWLLIALNHHRYITGSEAYAEMRETIAEWLIGLQDPNGGIKSGYNSEGPMGWKSTEGNLDCYAALVDYPVERAAVKSYLVNEMWIESEGRFRMGSTVTESSLDSCSFGVGALGGEYGRALEYAGDALFRTPVSDVTDRYVSGFADFLGEERIWQEGTGQMIVAYNLVGQEGDGQFYIAEMDKVMIASVEFPGTVGLACHSNDPAWETGSTTIFVPSQAWYLFGVWGFNPMQYRYAHLLDFDGNERVDFGDFCGLGAAWGRDASRVGAGLRPIVVGRVDFDEMAFMAENWLRDLNTMP